MLDRLFITTILISVITSVLIIIVHFLSPLIDKIYGAKCKYFIWLILAVRLVIPINFSLAEPPIKMTIPEAISLNDNIVLVTPSNKNIPEIIPYVDTNIPLKENIIQEQSKTDKNNEFFIIENLSIIWLFGALTFMLYQLIGYSILKRQIIRWSRTIHDNRIFDCLTKISTQMYVKRPINIRISEKATSPLIIGFFRPMLILPNDKYNDIDLDLILRHEIIHYKRQDLWYKLLLVTAYAMHWFNPIVWLMLASASKDIELFCDDEVMKGCDIATRTLYSEAIMKSIQSQKIKKVLLTTYFYGGTKIMKERFKNIFSVTNKRNSFTAIITMLIVVMVSSMMVGFTVNPQTKDIKNGNIPISSTIDNIYIEVYDCNIKVEKSIDDEFHYNYNPEKYSLSTDEDDNILNIQVDGKGIGAWTDMAIIFIPERWYDTITVIGDKAGISLPSGIDADFSIKSTNGAIGISVDEDFSRNIDFSCIDSSGNINILETATDYTLNMDGTNNAISVSDDFPNYKPNQPYQYINGDGKAKILLDIKDSSFSVNMETLTKVKMNAATIMDEEFYLIDTEEHLRAIGSGEYTLDKNYMLNADIEMSDKEWVSIGQSITKPFTGTFEGNGFTIEGMTMKDPNAKIAGFFGYAQSATLHNITLTDCDFSLAGSKAKPRSAGTIVVFAFNCTIDDNHVSFV